MSLNKGKKQKRHDSLYKNIFKKWKRINKPTKIKQTCYWPDSRKKIQKLIKMQNNTEKNVKKKSRNGKMSNT